MKHARHLSHKEATRALVALLLVFIALEACAAYHFYFTSRDVASAGLVIGGWFRESIKLLIERITESV